MKGGYGDFASLQGKSCVIHMFERFWVRFSRRGAMQMFGLYLSIHIRLYTTANKQYSL